MGDCRLVTRAHTADRVDHFASFSRTRELAEAGVGESVRSQKAAFICLIAKPFSIQPAMASRLIRTGARLVRGA
jgi:hypothetical protein